MMNNKYEQEFKKIRNTPFTDIANRAIVVGESREGISISYVSRVLHGERIPRIHYFVAIADAIGVSMEGLWEFLKQNYE